MHLLNIEIITPEQREELQELLKADSEKALSRMMEIFQETTQRQQQTINQLTEENQELKAKVAELEKDLKEINEVMSEMEEMTAQHQQGQNYYIEKK